MPVSNSFREYVAEQLGRVRPVTLRPMFGGIGIYVESAFFALIAADVLYFKVDGSNRSDYTTAGMEPFRPFGPDTTAMQYYAVPADVLDDVDLLGPWMDRAIAVAHRKRAKRR
ncbi:MAG TPA: TfoX/Sxy family protein [Gemmatimonadales bacterium]|jgi:DNA transformation protein